MQFITTKMKLPSPKKRRRSPFNDDDNSVLFRQQNVESFALIENSNNAAAVTEPILLDRVRIQTFLSRSCCSASVCKNLQRYTSLIQHKIMSRSVSNNHFIDQKCLTMNSDSDNQDQNLLCDRNCSKCRREANNLKSSSRLSEAMSSSNRWPSPAWQKFCSSFRYQHQQVSPMLTSLHHVMYIVLVALLFSQISFVRCKGVLTIELLTFNNSLGLTATGDCCDGALLPSASMCTGQCDMQFLICVDEFRSPYSIDQCKLQKLTPHVWHDQDVFVMNPATNQLQPHQQQFDWTNHARMSNNNNDLSESQNINGFEASATNYHVLPPLRPSVSSNHHHQWEPPSSQQYSHGLRVPSTQLSRSRDPAVFPLRPTGAAQWEPPAIYGRIPGATTTALPFGGVTHQQQRQQELVYPSATNGGFAVAPKKQPTWLEQHQPALLRGNNRQNVLLNRAASNVFGLNSHRQHQDSNTGSAQPSPLTIKRTANEEINVLKFYYDQWPGQVTIKIEARDLDASHASTDRAPIYDIVDAYQLDMIQFKPFAHNETAQSYKIFPLAGMRASFPPTQLTLRAGFQCAENYYGPECAVECLPQDTCDGHFICDDDTGQRRCMLGWVGADCNIQSRVDTICPPDVFCINGGVPVCQGPQPGQFYCCCPPSFSGQFCETMAPNYNNNAGGPPVIPVLRPTIPTGERTNIRNGSYYPVMDTTDAIDFSPPLRPSEATFFNQSPAAQGDDKPFQPANDRRLNIVNNNNNNQQFPPPSVPGFNQQHPADQTPARQQPPLQQTPTNPFNYNPSLAPNHTLGGGFQNVQPTRRVTPGMPPTTPPPKPKFTNPLTPSVVDASSSQRDDNFQQQQQNRHQANAGGVLTPANQPKNPNLFIDNVDVCKPNPCKNDGNCVQQRRGRPLVHEPEQAMNSKYMDAAFKCQCGEDFKGQLCEYSVACSDEPCQNGGVCRNDAISKSYFCECITQFVGRRCEIPVTCDYQPCLNGGTCVYNQVDGFQCLCTKKFNGVYCEAPTMEKCQQNPCQNNGTCYLRANGTSACRCEGDFGGRWCELLLSQSPTLDAEIGDKNFDACRNRPCLNGGFCTTGENNKFTCRCEPPFSGDFCEQQQQQTLCEPNSPCQNGATCLQNRLGLVCICSSKWHGDYCQIPRFGLTPIPSNKPVKNSVVLGQNDFSQNAPPLTRVTRPPVQPAAFDVTQAFVPWWQQTNNNLPNETTNFVTDPPADTTRLDEASVQPTAVTAQWMPKLHKNTNNKNNSRKPFLDAASPKQTSCAGILAPDYCLNGGQCEMTQPNTYVCHCADGFAGTRCEVELQQQQTPQFTSPPAFDGVVRATATIKTNMPPKTVATSRPKNPNGLLSTRSPFVLPPTTQPSPLLLCPDLQCANDGICRDVARPPATFTRACSCGALFYGRLCEHELRTSSPCPPPHVGLAFQIPCRNNGACALPQTGLPGCLCQPGFFGDLCQFAESDAVFGSGSKPQSGGNDNFDIATLLNSSNPFNTNNIQLTGVGVGVSRNTSPSKFQPPSFATKPIFSSITRRPPTTPSFSPNFFTKQPPTPPTPPTRTTKPTAIFFPSQPTRLTLPQSPNDLLADGAPTTGLTPINPQPEPTFALVVHGALQQPITPELITQLEKAIKDAWVSYYVGLNDASIRLRIMIDRKRMGEAYYGWENGQWYEIARIPYAVMLNGQPFDIEMVPHERFQPALKRANLAFLVFVGDIAFPQARTFDQFVFGKLPLKMAMNLEEELLRAWRAALSIPSSLNDASLYVVDVGDYVQQSASKNTNPILQTVVVGKPVTRLMYILVQNGTAIDPQRIPETIRNRFFGDLMLAPCLNCTLDNSLRVRRLIIRGGGSSERRITAPENEVVINRTSVRDAILAAWRESNPQRKFVLRSLDVENDYVDQNMTNIFVVDYALATAVMEESSENGLTTPAEKLGDLRAVVAPAEVAIAQFLQNTGRIRMCMDCEPFRVHEMKLILPFILDDGDVLHVHQALRRAWLRQNLLSSNDQQQRIIDIRPLRVLDAQVGHSSGAELQVIRYVVDLQGPAMNPAMRHHLQVPSIVIIEDELGTDFKTRPTQEDYMQPLTLTIPGAYNIQDNKKFEPLRQALLATWLQHQPALRCLSSISQCSVQIVLLKPIRTVTVTNPNELFKKTEQTSVAPAILPLFAIMAAPSITIPYFILRDSVRIGANGINNNDLSIEVKHNLIEKLGFVDEQITTPATPTTFIVQSKAFSLLLSGELQLHRDGQLLKTALEFWLARVLPPISLTNAQVNFISIWPYTNVDTGQQVTQINFLLVDKKSNVLDARLDEGLKLQKLMQESFRDKTFTSCGAKCHANRIEYLVLRPPQFNTEEELVEAFFRLLRSIERAIKTTNSGSTPSPTANPVATPSESPDGLGANLTLMHAEQGYNGAKQEVVLAIVANSHPLYPDILYDEYLYGNVQQAVMNEGFGWCSATTDCSFSPLFTLVLEPTKSNETGNINNDLIFTTPPISEIIAVIERVWRHENLHQQNVWWMQPKVILFNFTDTNNFNLVSSTSGQRVIVVNYIVQLPAYVMNWPLLRVPAVAAVSAELPRTLKLQQCRGDCAAIEPAHFLVMSLPSDKTDVMLPKTIEAELGQILVSNVQACTPTLTAKTGGLCRAHVVDIKPMLDASGQEAQRIDYVIHSPHGGIMTQSEFLKAKVHAHFEGLGYVLSAPANNNTTPDEEFVPLASLQTITLFGRIGSGEKRAELEQSLRRAVTSRSPASVDVRVMKLEHQVDPVRDTAFTKVFFHMINKQKSAVSLDPAHELDLNNGMQSARFAQNLNELNAGFRACTDVNECASIATLREVIIRGSEFDVLLKDDRTQLASALGDAWAFANPTAKRQDLLVTIRSTEPYWAFVVENTNLNNQSAGDAGGAGEPATRILYFFGSGDSGSVNNKIMRPPGFEFLKRALTQKSLKLCAMSADDETGSKNNCVPFKKHVLYVRYAPGIDEMFKEPNIESLIEQSVRQQSTPPNQVPTIRARVLKIDDNFVSYSRQNDTLQILIKVDYVFGRPDGASLLPPPAEYQNPTQDLLTETFRKDAAFSYSLCPVPLCEPAVAQSLFLINLPMNAVIPPTAQSRNPHDGSSGGVNIPDDLVSDINTNAPISASLDYVVSTAEKALTLAYRARASTGTASSAANANVKVKITRTGIPMVGRYNTPVLKLLLAPVNVQTQQIVKTPISTALLSPDATRAALETEVGIDVYRYGDDLLPLGSAFTMGLPARAVENSTNSAALKQALVGEWQRRVVGAQSVDIVMTLDYVNPNHGAGLPEKMIKLYYLLQKTNNVAIDARSLPQDLIEQVHNSVVNDLSGEVPVVRLSSRTVPIRTFVAEIEPTNTRYLRAVRDASLPHETVAGSETSLASTRTAVKIDLLRALEMLWSTANPARSPSVKVELLELRPMVDENLLDYLELQYYVYSMEADSAGVDGGGGPLMLREPSVARTREAFKPLGLNVCVAAACKVNPTFMLLLVEDDSIIPTQQNDAVIQNVANERVRAQIEQSWQALNAANWNGFFSLAFINMRWLPRARLEFRYGVFPSVVSGQRLKEPTIAQLDDNLRQIGLQVCKACGQPLPEVYLIGPVRQLGDEFLKTVLALAWEKSNEAFVVEKCGVRTTNTPALPSSKCTLVEPKIIAKTELVGKLGTDVWKIEYQLKPVGGTFKTSTNSNRTNPFTQPIPLQAVYDVLEEQPLSLYEPAATISAIVAAGEVVSGGGSLALLTQQDLTPKSSLFSVKTEGVLSAEQIERVENELNLLWRVANPTEPPLLRIVLGNVFVILNSAVDKSVAVVLPSMSTVPPLLGTEVLYRVTRTGAGENAQAEEPRNTELHVPVDASIAQALRDKLSIIPCSASPACTKHSHRLYDVYLKRPWLEAQNIELVKALESAWSSRISDSSPIQVNIIDGAPYAALTYTNQIPEWEQVTRVRYATIPAYPSEMLPSWLQLERALETLTSDARLVSTSPHRLHTILVHGSGVNLIRRDLQAVTGALLNAWSSANRLQQPDNGNNSVRITITSATQTLINSNGTSITFVEYFVTIDGVPVQNHMFVREPTRPQFDAYLRNVAYPICDCLARGRKYFFLRGVNATQRAVQLALEHGLEQAWQVRNAMLVGRQQLQVEVIDVDNKFEDKQNREVSRITYDVFLKYDQDKLPDLSLPTLKEIEKHMKSFLANNPRIDVLENAIVHEKLVDSSGQTKSSSSSSARSEINLLSAWAIALIVLIVWVAVLLLVVMLVLMCRQRQKRKHGDITAIQNAAAAVGDNGHAYFVGGGKRFERAAPNEGGGGGQQTRSSSSGTSQLSSSGGAASSSLVDNNRQQQQQILTNNTKMQHLPGDVSARVALLFQAPSSNILHRPLTATNTTASSAGGSPSLQQLRNRTSSIIPSRQQPFEVHAMRRTVTRIPEYNNHNSNNVDVEFEEDLVVNNTTHQHHHHRADDDRL